MIDVSRRTFMATAVAAPLLQALRANAAPLRRVALYDPTLDAGATFAERAAELHLTVDALDQDRVSLFRSILAKGPQSVWGVSRHADQLLASGIMREHGYRANLKLRCLPADFNPQGGQTATTLKRIPADRRGAAFAEIAAGAPLTCETLHGEETDRAAIFWSFQRIG